jgi:nitrogen fixation protein NifB
MTPVVPHESLHHCCSGQRRGTGRVQLPVAPRAQARIRFSPETPLPRALTPAQAINWLEYLEDEGEKVKVASLTGPGDPLATPELTLETLTRLRTGYPGLSLCLTTLGFGARELAPKLAKFGLAHVSILMDAVTPVTAQRLYAWIRPGKKTLPLGRAAEMLISEQAAAVSALKDAGITVQAKTTVYPGINDHEVEDLARTAAGLGAGAMKLFPFVPRGEDHPLPSGQSSPRQLVELAALARRHLATEPVDLAQCVEMARFEAPHEGAARAILPKPSQKRPKLAVCSSDGFEVDLHLGQASQYLIYGPQDGPVVLLENRPAPEPGSGGTRWEAVSLVLSDCFAILAAAAGEAPKRVLAQRGLQVLTQEGNIEGWWMCSTMAQKGAAKRAARAAGNYRMDSRPARMPAVEGARSWEYLAIRSWCARAFA